LSTREPGTVLEDKYEILQLLGSGGMGDIYLVRHLHLDQKRVIKILRQELAASEGARKRFLREAQLATSIKHPNVAILYDYSKLADDSYYMVWEYIEGNDVHRWLERYGPFPLHAALQLGIQALRGLEAIHAAGMIHRDISPDNLMITRDVQSRYQTKIIDLGLAKSLTSDPDHEITQAGMFMGKLQYCSPEQVGVVKGQSLDRRSDLYSFSMVLYEMITGMPPFANEDAHGFIFGRLNMDPIPLTGRNPAVKVPPALNDILLKGLARDRDQRYDTAIQYIQALAPIEAALNQTATQLIPTPTPLPKSGTPSGAPTEVPSSAQTVPAPGTTIDDDRAVTRRPTTSSLSPDERRKLLAQIDEAAKRVRRSASPEALGQQIQAAIAGGQLREAGQMIEMLESADPTAAALRDLQTQLEEAQAHHKATAVDRAAARIKEVSKLSDLAEEALRAGKIQEAEELVEALEATNPGSPALHALRARLEEATGSVVASDPTDAAETESAAETAAPAETEAAPAASRPTSQVKALEERIQDAEAMLSGYLKNRQANLANLALEALLDLAPEHPRKEEFTSWVRMVEGEEQQQGRAQEALEKGRQALAEGNTKAARKQLEIIARNDAQGRLAETFLEELEAAARDVSDTEEVDRHKVAFEAALENQDLAEAERTLSQLTALDPPKLTLTLYRNRLEEARFETRFQACIAAEDWKGARSVAHEVSEALPKSQRPAAMFAQADRGEQARRRQESIVQGSQQIEAFLEAGDLDRASLALKILVQMDPDDPRWQDYQQQIENQAGS
jgi:serine/threonine protein kinase